MKNKFWIISVASVFLLLITGLFIYSSHRNSSELDYSKLKLPESHEMDEEHEQGEEAREAAGRAEYYFRMLRDPATNRIPKNIRSRELAYAKTLPNRRDIKRKDATNGFTWEAGGPNNIGGRTRALGIDVRDPNTIIAGGVSGGVWKSTDGGQNWELKTDPDQNLSVTSLAQDPRPGHQDTWYYTAGEFIGNTATDFGYKAFYYGTGVYRSLDNGETWQRIPSTEDTDTSFNSMFDFTSKIQVNPTTGSVFLASNGFGIYRSTDGGNSFNPSSPILGVRGEQIYSSFDISANGNIVAALSTASFDANTSANNKPGIFFSDDDGDSWKNITPSTFPSSYERSVISIAPSNQNIAYIMTYVAGSDSTEDIRLHRLNLANGTSQDLSDNIPNFGGKVGYMSTQSNYNMTLAVKPDDENFVVMGGINLFRSADGFSTQPDTTDKDRYWIGGYSKDNNASLYPNQHPDQHVLVFDRNNPNKLWAGHDGGISLTNDVTASSVSWTSLNNGYVTTQFYTAALPKNAGDDRFMGGTQDNGTLFFNFNNASARNNAIDLSSGDGGVAYFGTDNAYVSTQNGKIRRLDYNQGQPVYTANWSYVHPKEAENQLLVHPYIMNPNDENVMFYPGGNVMWRNNAIRSIHTRDDAGAVVGWTKLSNINVPSGFNITALEISRVPSNILYYAGSYSGSSNQLPPKIYSLANANTALSGKKDISISGAAAGAFVHDIAVNPKDANELIVVMSNYNITGIFHSTNGGQSWDAVEGNLTGSGGSNPGPSIRAAAILPANEKTVYAVGTSTGVYTTTDLNGSNTQWLHESASRIGYAVTDGLVMRNSDGTTIAATHGRGIFVGTYTGTTTPIENVIPDHFALYQNQPNPFRSVTAIPFLIPERSAVSLSIYDTQGRKVRDLLRNVTYSADSTSFYFNGQDLSSGVYLYHIQAHSLDNGGKTFTKTGKMTLIK